MQAIVGTGPLVAFLDRSERHHLWVAARVEELNAPLLVCEAVLTEAMYFLVRFAKAQDALFNPLENGALMVAFHLDDNIGTRRCRWPTRVSFAWRNSMTITQY